MRGDRRRRLRLGNDRDRDWAYSFWSKKNSTPMIDLWVLPKEVPTKPLPKKPAMSLKSDQLIPNRLIGDSLAAHVIETWWLAVNPAPDVARLDDLVVWTMKLRACKDFFGCARRTQDQIHGACAGDVAVVLNRGLPRVFLDGQLAQGTQSRAVGNHETCIQPRPPSHRRTRDLVARSGSR